LITDENGILDFDSRGWEEVLKAQEKKINDLAVNTAEARLSMIRS
jgi:hypothetical protein